MDKVLGKVPGIVVVGYSVVASGDSGVSGIHDDLG